MDVNGYSAYIMDLLVKRINEYKSTLDYNVALKEYALSTLTETRNLSLGSSNPQSSTAISSSKIPFGMYLNFSAFNPLGTICLSAWGNNETV